MNNIQNNTDAYFEACLKSLSDMKAQNIIAYELKDYPLILERVVMCTANNGIHLHAMTESLKETYRQYKASLNDVSSPFFSGTAQSGWMIGDADICLVHLFTEEMRAYYNLDELFAN